MKLLNKGFLLVKLKSLLGKFYGRKFRILAFFITTLLTQLYVRVDILFIGKRLSYDAEIT
jgi:hypothetical protein